MHVLQTQANWYTTWSKNRSKYASGVIAFYSEAISEGAKLEALGKCEFLFLRIIPAYD